MSSARDSNWRPQPPNLQEFEKKEAAAMPVMVPVHSLGAEGRGGVREPGSVSEEARASGPGREWSGAERGADTGAAGQTGRQRQAQLGGRRDGGCGGGLVAGYVTMCLPVEVTWSSASLPASTAAQ